MKKNYLFSEQYGTQLSSLIGIEQNDISVELKYVDSNGDQILDELFEEWATYSIIATYEKTKRFNV